MNSSRCSARPDAASRRRCAFSPACSSPASGDVVWRDGNAPDGSKGDIGFVFQEPTLMPWASVAGNVYLPLKLAGIGRAAAMPRITEALAPCRARGLRRCLSARTVRRHEDAGLDRTRAGDEPEAPADGRAVRRARRDHPLQAEQRPADAVGGDAPDRDLRHPFGVRVGLSVEPHHRDDPAPRPRACGDRGGRALSAHRSVPHLAGLCRALPHGVGGAGRGHATMAQDDSSQGEAA